MHFLPGKGGRNGTVSSENSVADGRYVVFVSNANGENQIYLHDRKTGTTELVSGVFASQLAAQDLLTRYPIQSL